MGAHKAVTLNPNEVLNGLKVLFVDDSRDERELFSAVFEGYGARVTIAATADEALERFERATPDLVISNLALPDRDGYSLIESIRQLPAERGGATPAIALNFWVRDRDRQKAIEAGYGGIIAKPVDYDDLLCAIADLGGQITSHRGRNAPTAAASEHGAIAPPRDQPPSPPPVPSAAPPAPHRAAAPAAPRAETGTGNTVLDGLPARELEAILRSATTVRLDPEQTIANIGEPWGCVYYPVRSVVSLLCIVESGKTVEVCPVGRHGIVGLSAAVGPGESLYWARVLVGGDTLRLRAQDMRALVQEFPLIDAALRRAAHTRFAELSQAAICNRVHTIDRQLARWLIAVSDGAQSSVLRLTHEGIATRFGTRRSSISLALEEFQRRELISASRGRIRLVDREGLRAMACECLDAVAARAASSASRADAPRC